MRGNFSKLILMVQNICVEHEYIYMADSECLHASSWQLLDSLMELVWWILYLWMPPYHPTFQFLWYNH